MGAENSISPFVVKRLPRYYRYLGGLIDKGVTRVSSKELSEIMNVTASQIRQDFNQFGNFGQQGYGYNVQYLYDEVKKILGLVQHYSMIIVGAGNLGQALANYDNFTRRGFVCAAMFDSNAKKVGKKVNGIDIFHSNTLECYLEKNPTDIAVLAIPETQAQLVAQVLYRHNIKAIWNFSNTELEAPEGVCVENVHLMDSLMTLAFNVRKR